MITIIIIIIIIIVIIIIIIIIIMIIIVIMFIIIIKINNIFGGCTDHNKRLAEPYVQNRKKIFTRISKRG